MSSDCPKCSGADWKSAKMIVLEGTSSSDGVLDGELTEKGAFHGSVRDFFLSDRWFDYESPIEAKFSSTTTTALVDEVKSLLVSEGNARPMPKMPTKPHMPPKPVRPTDPHSGLKSIFSQSPLETSQPSRPDAPHNPVEDVPSFEARTYWQNLSNNLWWSVLIITTVMAGVTWFLPSTMANIVASVASIFSFVPEDHPFRQIAITSFSFQIPLVSEWVLQQAFEDKTIRRISVFSLLLLFLALRLVVAPFRLRLSVGARGLRAGQSSVPRKGLSM